MRHLRVVIPVYGQFDFLTQCLASLRESAEFWGERTSVHVIDGGSPESPPESVLHEIGLWPAGCFRYERWEKNLGVTLPWNKGLRQGMAEGADVVCISNSDVVYGENVLRECVRAVTDAGYGAAFPFTPEKIHRGVPLPPYWDDEHRDFSDDPFECVDTGGFAGWCFFIPRRTVEKFGYFDEQFTLWYQDSQYHWRLARGGCRPVEVRSCLLHHFESRTILSMPQQFECHGWRAQDAKNWEQWTARWKDHADEMLYVP